MVCIPCLPLFEILIPTITIDELNKTKMTHTKKQLKITKLFGKRATTKVPEDCDELLEEIQQLQQNLQEKHNELFQIQRNSYRHKVCQPKSIEVPFIRPQKIILNNSVETLKRNIELMSMMTGIEVESYVADKHCSIVYHMQHKSDQAVKHGLKIDMSTGVNEVENLSLPIGFNLKAVVQEFDNILIPTCLGAIWKGLVAYYDRLEQFEKLKKHVVLEAELFKSLDGSHIEISFYAQSHEEEEDKQIRVTLILDYRIYDIRPKTYCFMEKDLPDGVLEILTQQCLVFKTKPLRKAFKEAFKDGVGTYNLVQQFGPRRQEQPRRQKRFKPNKHNYNNDDTFLPEDCSDQEEDEYYNE